MKLRITALVVILAVLGAVALVPAGRSHAATVPSTRPVSGALNLSGLPATFSGAAGAVTGTITSLHITGFQTGPNNTLQAVGTATYMLTGSTTPQTSTFTATVDPPAGSCPILTLHIGAINLDLLGLVVTTSPIDLNITAQPGPGNLLGNLLCAVANLLNGNSNALTTLLNQIVGLLNQLVSSL